MLGNTSSLISSRGMAAVIDSVVIGSLLLLNRRNDCLPVGTGNAPQCGLNLYVSANDNQGQYALDVEGGIIMSSTRDGSGGNQEPYAAENVGGGTVKSDFAMIRKTGDYYEQGTADFDPDPTNGHSGPIFLDPTRGKDDPPLTSASLFFKNHSGGVLVGSTDPNAPRIVTDGIHFPTYVDNSGEFASGNSLDITGYVKFEPLDGKFGEFIFPGGVDIKGANTNVEFGPGRYVFAGSKLAGGNPAPLFQMRSNAVVTDGILDYTSAPANGGELFIFAGPTYEGSNGESIQDVLNRGVGPHYDLPVEVSSMSYGTAELKGGNNPGTEINLHGLNPENTNVPLELKEYKSILAWQDRENSVYQYGDNEGNYNAAGCDGSDPNLCKTTNNPDATELVIGASPDVHLWGVIYQPRGAFTTMIGGGGYSGPIQLVSGGLRIQGNAQLNMGIISNPLTIKTISLIE